MQTDFDQELMSAKVTRVPVILRYTRAITRKWMKRQCSTPPRVDIDLGRYKIVVHLCVEVPHKPPEGKIPKPVKI